MYIGSSFTILPPVPETGCPIGHTGLTVDRCRFVAQIQVDRTCVSLAPTTRETWPNISDSVMPAFGNALGSHSDTN